MTKTFIDEQGATHDTIYVNGYQFAERVLEGVFAAVSFDDKGKLKVVFLDKYSSYLNTLNAKSYLKLATAYVQSCLKEGELDVFTITPTSAPSPMIVDVQDNAPSVKTSKSRSRAQPR